MAIAKTVANISAQQAAVIKAVAQLQTAKTPQEFEDDIKKLSAADNQ